MNQNNQNNQNINYPHLDNKLNEFQNKINKIGHTNNNKFLNSFFKSIYIYIIILCICICIFLILLKPSIVIDVSQNEAGHEIKKINILKLISWTIGITIVCTAIYFVLKKYVLKKNNVFNK